MAIFYLPTAGRCSSTAPGVRRGAGPAHCLCLGSVVLLAGGRTPFLPVNPEVIAAEETRVPQVFEYLPQNPSADPHLQHNATLMSSCDEEFDLNIKLYLLSHKLCNPWLHKDPQRCRRLQVAKQPTLGNSSAIYLALPPPSQSINLPNRHLKPSVKFASTTSLHSSIMLCVTQLFLILFLDLNKKLPY